MKGVSFLGFQDGVLVFTPQEVASWHRATTFVDRLPESGTVRCHEITRAVYKALDSYGLQHYWEVVDGVFGHVDHSWLVGKKTDTILDVYAVGSLPMVQLINTTFLGVRDARRYKEGCTRKDINEVIIVVLASHMKATHDGV